MNVTVMAATQKPLDLISLAAGNCYGKSDISHKRVRTCIRAGHHSVLEHASATFKITGISRACLAQLTRHRMASFCVTSQRYCKVDGEDWYVMPPSMRESEEAAVFFKESMENQLSDYKAALINGVKPEDARFLLPEATKTSVYMTVNARELMHIMDMRLSNAAQWEIRALVSDMVAQLALEDQWETLLAWMVEER